MPEIIGSCMGGGFALLSAPRLNFAAASVNYGEVPEDAAEQLAGSCPVVASYGGLDRTLPGRAERLERALSELGCTTTSSSTPAPVTAS
ncbi:MAG: dienelactone hydrolase family protein [Actinomycetota bacterium]|nr:dienelactone hydrolase family protein [Actinomycetota bacterium]